MSIQSDVHSIPRVGIPEAMTKIIEELRSGTGLSISGLAKKTGVDRRTVDKVVNMLVAVQDVLHSLQIEKDRVGRSYVIRLQARTERARKLLASAKERVSRRGR
jgi:predicted regulator of amino acid metabolism with ACT domain